MHRMSKKIAHGYLALGLLMSIGTYWHLHSLESEKARHLFRSDVDQHSSNIEQQLAQQRMVVHGLANGISLYTEPDPGAFKQLCKSLQRRDSMIASLSWYWYISDRRRSALEHSLSDYYSSFQIRRFEGNDSGRNGNTSHLRTMERQRHYLPLVAICPQRTLEQFLGLDLYSEAAMLEPLTQSVSRDQVYASGAYTHTGSDQAALDFAMFAPVYRQASDSQRRLLAGFVSATFAIEDLLARELQARLGEWVVRIQMADGTESGNGIFTATPMVALAPEDYSYSRNIEVSPNRDWLIYARPGRDYIDGERTRLPLWGFLVGLALTALIYYIWLSQLNRTRSIETVVAERTAALSVANQQLRELSQTDALTGIANRRLFQERLHNEWLRLRRAKKFMALMMIDVDDFKAYNDHYGHQQGDQCLVRIAQAIAATVNRPADLVARYGGEEFIVLLPDTDDKALELADEILRAIRKLDIPHKQSRASDRVSISIGFGFAQANQLDSPQQLMIAADKAMYHAKAAGRNRIAYAMAASTEAKPVNYPSR